jgi:hypothetical protein
MDEQVFEHKRSPHFLKGPRRSGCVATKRQKRTHDLIHLNSVRSPAANYVLVYLKAAGAEMPATLINGGQYMAKRGDEE